VTVSNDHAVNRDWGPTRDFYLIQFLFAIRVSNVLPPDLL